jgi:hypothetical protein
MTAGAGGFPGGFRFRAILFRGGGDGRPAGEAPSHAFFPARLRMHFGLCGEGGEE